MVIYMLNISFAKCEMKRIKNESSNMTCGGYKIIQNNFKNKPKFKKIQGVA